ncbi:MAG: carboxylating nicotinate-nucleotide diphosphorylase [Acidobacteria bacterium]|nr:carboxylating nicotinate-nucleotide diphosphorylase [Acidobacteriota bacterium]
MTLDPLRRSGIITLDPVVVRHEIRRFLAEDVGTGDVTTERVVPSHATGRGWIMARQACVIAGLDLARAVFCELDATLSFKPTVDDGGQVAAGTQVVLLEGRVAPILTGERLALNLLQRLSGIATITRRYVNAIAGTSASVSDTRKTTPGLRVFEKYAVRTGGGRNHRLGLFDAVLIKDNHIAAAGGVEQAIRAARGSAQAVMPIQVEIDTPDQLALALECGVDAVLLDNMTPERVAACVATIRAHPRGRGCWIEASGGITLQNIRAYAEADVDTISVGTLTHSAPSVDLALDVESRPALP